MVGRPLALQMVSALMEGVFLKSGAGLIGFNGDAQLLLAGPPPRSLRFQNAPQFTELTGVAGRCTNFDFRASSMLPLPGQQLLPHSPPG